MINEKDFVVRTDKGSILIYGVEKVEKITDGYFKIDNIMIEISRSLGDIIDIKEEE